MKPLLQKSVTVNLLEVCNFRVGSGFVVDADEEGKQKCLLLLLSLVCKLSFTLNVLQHSTVTQEPTGLSGCVPKGLSFDFH